MTSSSIRAGSSMRPPGAYGRADGPPECGRASPGWPGSKRIGREIWHTSWPPPASGHASVLRFVRQSGRFFAALVRPLVWLAIFAAGFRSVLGLSPDPALSDVLTYEVYIAPGLVGMVLLFHAMQTALSMVYDREMGSMKVLLTSPVPRPVPADRAPVRGLAGRPAAGLRLPRCREAVGYPAARRGLPLRAAGCAARRSDAGRARDAAVIDDPATGELRGCDELRDLSDVFRLDGPLPLWRLKDTNPVVGDGGPGQSVQPRGRARALRLLRAAR